VSLSPAATSAPLATPQDHRTVDPVPEDPPVHLRGPLLPEQTSRSRVTGLTITALATLVATVWAGFDRAVEPAWATTFLVARLVGDVPMLTCLWLLWCRPVGRRHPGALTTAALAVVQIEVAWMVVRVEHLELYLLGFTLALYCSGTLSSDRTRWTGLLAGISWAALAGAAVTAPAAPSWGDLAGAAFFLGTATLVSVLAHHLRWRLAVGELAARLRLEREQERTRALLVRLERLSNEDPLTGLANRRRWDAELARACDRVAHGEPPFTLVLMDVDHFKRINDEYGHPAGDAALRALADLLRTCVRADDLAARIGGDELAVLLPGADLGRAVLLAEQLREAAQLLRPEGFGATGISVSMGVASSAVSGADPEALLAAVDAQLYRAKQTRNAVRAPAPSVG
jgi:diguanylate cyclase (GGDEF)-like protein